MFQKESGPPPACAFEILHETTQFTFVSFLDYTIQAGTPKIPHRRQEFNVLQKYFLTTLKEGVKTCYLNNARGFKEDTHKKSVFF